MIGPPPVISLRPDTQQAQSFLRVMLATVAPAPTMTWESPAQSWGQAYRCRPRPCGGVGARLGARCVRCGSVVP